MNPPYLLAKGRPSLPLNPLADVQRWEYTGNLAHPIKKAISVIEPLVESFAPPGGIVLEPFSGSGSTLVSAALAGRRYLGVEPAEKYAGWRGNGLRGSSGSCGKGSNNGRPRHRLRDRAQTSEASPH
jgi:DNA methylase